MSHYLTKVTAMNMVREASQSSFDQTSEDTCIFEQEFSWNVEVPHKDLGVSSGIAGLYQVKLNKGGFILQRQQEPHNTMILPLHCIRSCGCMREKFYIELGRSAITGEGKLWMLLKNATTAKTMKKTCSRFFGKKSVNGSNSSHRRRTQSLSIGRVTFSDDIPNSSENIRSDNTQPSRNRSSSFVRNIYTTFRRCVSQKQEENVDVQGEQCITPGKKTPNTGYIFKRSMSDPRVPTISGNTGPPTGSRGPSTHTELRAIAPKLERVDSTSSSDEVRNYNYRDYNKAAIKNNYYTMIEESPFEREKHDLRRSLPRKPSVVDNLCRKAEQYLPTEQYLQMTPKQECRKKVIQAGPSNANNSYLSMNAHQTIIAPGEYLLMAPAAVIPP